MMKVNDLNMKEIAKLAGVSTATVSRVLNHSGKVKESTRKKIEELIEQTGYRPNVLARELAEKKTNLIGLIVHAMTGEGIPKAVNGLNEQLSENGYSLLIAGSNGIFENEMKQIELFRQKRVEGMVFATRQFTEEHEKIMKKLPFPVVILMQDTDSAGISNAGFDNFQLAKEAASSLLSLGHRRFAYIGGPESSDSAVLRENGVKAALKEYGVYLRPALQKRGSYHIGDGYTLMKQILNEQEKPTAVLAGNDGMAVGAVNCLLQHGYRVPEDVSVMGLDDTDLAQASIIPLSGVQYSYTALGREAANMMIQGIEAGELLYEKRILPHNICIRQSVSSI
ncbi:LacI family DNA-binding transcriptional regulator [Metabacillus lacus]|nr:LacI family DNA-binding transcriptional regulator [Metabacillus lacus]